MIWFPHQFQNLARGPSTKTLLFLIKFGQIGIYLGKKWEEKFSGVFRGAMAPVPMLLITQKGPCI